MPAIVRLISCTLLAMALATAASDSHANLSKEQIDALVAFYGTREVSDFDAFLGQLANSPISLNEGLAEVIGAYRNQNPITGELNNILARLLGVYSRLKYGDEALQTLERLVAIPTYRVSGLPQHENPEFHRFAMDLDTIANDFGLQFRNVDERVYEVTLPGSSDDIVGIHAHADVVPVNPQLWVLEDGTQLNPFQVTRVGDRLYGRGTEAVSYTHLRAHET